MPSSNEQRPATDRSMVTLVDVAPEDGTGPELAPGRRSTVKHAEAFCTEPLGLQAAFGAQRFGREP